MALSICTSTLLHYICFSILFLPLCDIKKNPRVSAQRSNKLIDGSAILLIGWTSVPHNCDLVFFFIAELLPREPLADHCLTKNCHQQTLLKPRSIVNGRLRYQKTKQSVLLVVLESYLGFCNPNHGQMMLYQSRVQPCKLYNVEMVFIQNQAIHFTRYVS